MAEQKQGQQQDDPLAQTGKAAASGAAAGAGGAVGNAATKGAMGAGAL